MYTGSLGTVSNKEDWIQSIDVLDDDGADVDISAATITMAVRKSGCSSPELEATNGDGVTISSPRFTFTFDADDMDSLTPGAYDVGVLIEISSVKTQLIVGTVNIVDGIVS